jgi:hypothetical protein
MLISLSVMVVGPRFGEWLAGRVHLSGLFVLLWPYIHWTIAVGFTVLAIEALYFLAPNVKQRFLATLPGAVLSVGCWIGLSYLLGTYFRHFGSFNKTYGTLGAAIALMVWLYWTRFCHAGGGGTQCGTGEDKQRRQAAREARPSRSYKNGSCGLNSPFCSALLLYAVCFCRPPIKLSRGVKRKRRSSKCSTICNRFEGDSLLDTNTSTDPNTLSGNSSSADSSTIGISG